MQRKSSNIAGNMIYFSIVVFDFIYHTILNWKFDDMEKLLIWKDCPPRIFLSLLMQKWRVQWFSCKPCTATGWFWLQQSHSVCPQLQPLQFSCRQHRHSGSRQNPHSQFFFCVPRQDLELLFYSFAAISLRQLSFVTWSISALKSFQQLSFWLGKRDLTKPPWLLVAILSVLSA